MIWTSIAFFALLSISISTKIESRLEEEPSASQVIISNFTTGGNGCPQGAAGLSLSSDRKSFSVSFDKYQAYNGPGTSVRDKQPSCDLTVNLTHPADFQYSVSKTTYHGYAMLDQGVTGTMQAVYYFTTSAIKNSTTRAKISGPIRDVFTVNTEVPESTRVWSPCGVNLPLLKKTRNYKACRRALNLNRTIEPYFGLDPANDVNLKQNDVLAERLLKDGEPIEYNVRDVIDLSFLPCDKFLGNVQANDTMKVDYQAGTKNYQFVDDVPNALDGIHSNKLWDGLLGGWLPSPCKIFRGTVDSQDWIESVIFADVDSRDPTIVHLWFATKWVKGGVAREKNFALDYPEFFHAYSTNSKRLLSGSPSLHDYWESKIQDFSLLNLPDLTWADMAKHAFAVELVQRFQDIFTTSLTANLAWGRFKQASAIFENYMDWYVYDNGDIKMRGPEVPQFGMSLSLVARYVQYTGDTALIEKYKGKILTWAKLLTDLHDESLKLPVGHPYYGLLSGWGESDASLNLDSWRWSKPYWNNGAFTARGLKDLSKIPILAEYSEDWTSRAFQIINQTSRTLDRFHVIEDLTENEATSPAKWAHRVYAELLHASVLSSTHTDLVINSMQAYGITSLGVVANVTPLHAKSRDILGFISYGYALALLLQDRIDEFILFLYTHRYHIHNRGLWIAPEVAGTGGNSTTYCQPSQFGVPIVLRAALLFEHPGEEVLFVTRGVPRKWLSKVELGSRKHRRDGDSLALRHNWTQLDKKAGTIKTVLSFEKSPPGEVRIKFRLPKGRSLKAATINGTAAKWKGEEVIWKVGSNSMVATFKNVTIVGSF
ncbi:hypothetical protein BKA65DRAFT_551201 [Rhexocercosporidium sp. MPI-PUGE-AT-0058]|nr:hypothetical protein BKA65DRAFT_551201 [Rhexocercosporidium sp. MPI-PUGE-AT-0058]